MTRRPALMPLLAVCAGIAAVGAARAQDAPSPYYIGAATSFTRDSNVFRVGESTPKDSDTITAVTLLGGFDQPIGRQRVYARGNVSRNEFADNPTLTNTSYGLKAGLNWETIERFAGDFTASANQSLARFNPDDGPSTTLGNTQRSEQLSANVRMGLVTQLSAYAGVSRRTLRFSADEFDSREFDQDSVNAGLRYRFSGLLTTGAGLRHSSSTYPSGIQTAPGVFEEDDVVRDDFDLTATWVPTGASTVNGRVSFSYIDHLNIRESQRSNVTGLVSWNWRPTGKLSLVTSLSRETGEESTFLVLDDVTVNSADYSRINTTLQSQLNYAMTAKIGLTARIRYSDRDLERMDGSGDGADQTSVVGLGVRWAPTRILSLSCDVSQEKRRSSGDLSTPYTFGTVGCSAQATLDF
jgi:hypothetical protein